MKTSTSLAALLGTLPLGIAQHKYDPPHPGPHSRPWPASWSGYPGTSATASSSAPSSSSTSGSGSGSGNGSAQSCTPLTVDEVDAMGNNSLFTRWRPHSHFMAPAGWMNDPCGPMYDPTRDEYHLFYQWHPQHINWGCVRQSVEIWLRITLMPWQKHLLGLCK